jgi:hypothetical protein
MALSGHVKGKGVGTLISHTDGGTPVLQMLSNYQMLDHGGEAWLRVLRFSPRDKAGSRRSCREPKKPSARGMPRPAPAFDSRAITPVASIGISTRPCSD